MKIGDGGLQGLATHDDVAARLEQERQLRKPGGTENLDKDRDMVARLDEDALNKAVEKLNENTQAHNLPLEFAVKKEEGQIRIQMRNTESGKIKEVGVEDLPRLVKGIEENRGLIIDEYF